MKKNAKKITFALAVALFFCSLFVFHKPILCFVIKKQFAKYDPSLSDTRVSFKSISLKKNTLEIRDLALYDPSCETDLLHIKEIDFHLVLKAFPFKFKTFITLLEPNFVLLKKERKNKKRDYRLYRYLSSFKSFKKLQVQNGSVSFLDENKNLTGPFLFSFNPSPRAEEVGVFHLRFSEEKGHLMCALELKNQKAYVTVGYEDLVASKAQKILSFFFPKLDLLAKVSEGNLEGQIEFAVNKEECLVAANSNLFFSKMQIESEEISSSFACKKTHVSFALPQGKSISFRKAGFITFLKDLMVQCEIELGSMQRKDKEPWKIEDFSGKAAFNHQTMPTLNFTALLQREEKQYPITIAGKGWIDTEKSFWTDIDVNLYPQNEESRHASFYFALLNEGHYFGKTSITGFKKEQLEILQSLAALSFPLAKEVHIEEGEVSCDLAFEFQKGKIESVSFEHVYFKNIKGFFRDQFTLESLEEVKGKCKIYFPLLHPHKAPSCDLQLKGANFFLKDKAEVFSDTNLELVSRNFEMQKGILKTTFGNVLTEIDLVGPFSMLDSQITFTMQEGHIFSDKQQKVKELYKEILPLSSVELCSKMKLEQGKLSFLGDVNLLYREEKADRLCFGVHFEKAGDLSSLFSLDYWKTGLKRGWFKSEQFSENSYLWFLSLYKQQWIAKGDMQVNGKFDSKNLDFTLRSKKAFYDADDLQVTLESPNSYHEGTFSFSFVEKLWKIDIPLQEVSCIDKRYQLPFEKVKGNLHISGTSLKVESLEAFCENVAFAGKLELDFANPNWLDLKLYPHKISGEAEDFLRFLRYLPDFKNFDVPLKGRIESRHENAFLTKYNKEKSEKTAELLLELKEGSLEITDSFHLEKASCTLFWDSEKNFLEIKDLEANAVLQKENEQKNYRLQSRYLLSKNLLENAFEFDVRMESPTYDVLRFVGQTYKQDGMLKIDFEKDLSHFFGAKIDLKKCSLDANFNLEEIDVCSSFSSLDLFNQLQCLYLAGFLPLSHSVFEDLKNTKTEGELFVSLSYDRKEEGFQTEVASRGLLFDKILIEDLSIQACKNHNHFVLQKCKTKDLSALLVAEKQGADWKIPVFELHYKDSFFNVATGVFCKESSKLSLDLEKVCLNLSQFGKENQTEAFTLLGGMIQGEGNIQVDFSNGIKHTNLSSELKLSSDDFTSAKLQLQTKSPIKIAFTAKDGLLFENAKLAVSHSSLDHLSCSLETKALQYFPFSKTMLGKQLHISIPPEMLVFLIGKGWFQNIAVKENVLQVFGKEVPWDNEIDTELDFIYEKGMLRAEGYLAEGYYWLKEKSLYLQKVRYSYENEKLQIALGLDYADLNVEVLSKIHLGDEVRASVNVIDRNAKEEESEGLQISCRYSKADGFSLQSVDGEIYGLDFSLQRNPKTYLPHVMILTGQVKIDSFGLVRTFPKLFYQTFKELGMGKGYELSGDFVFSKKDLFSSYFKGFLKGRDFEFLGFHFKTLLSEVEVSSKSVSIHEFRLSDKSGVCQIKEVKIYKSDEDGSWQMIIPEINIQDFRPSFLKKNQAQEDNIKPFMIRDMHIFNIQGALGYKESFTGRGYLDFINTFKRDYNLLDIPIEIIGRIGFDLGLFIPVRGKLEFEMKEGKIFLNELKNTFSEGKRSRFYLSDYKDSFIGLDGSMFIDIKMKQYVLLKITEPFTLSIRGTLMKPKYSLR